MAYRFFTLKSLGFASIGILIGWFWLQQQSKVMTPQAILVLGGAPQRERFAAKFAQQHPDLPVWVSGGSNPEYAEWVFEEAGIAEQRIHLDYQAVDTLTNFTTLVETFKTQGIEHVYLITSDYHMRRAQWIGQFVLGSRGIQFEAIAIPTKLEQEPLGVAVFDGSRALLWVATGKTGASLKSMSQLEGMSLERKAQRNPL